MGAGAAGPGSIQCKLRTKIVQACCNFYSRNYNHMFFARTSNYCLSLCRQVMGSARVPLPCASAKWLRLDKRVRSA